MGENRRKWAVFPLLLVLAAFLKSPAAAGEAPDLTGGICGERRIEAIRVQERAYELKYKVWSTDKVNRQYKPLALCLLLDVSGDGGDSLAAGKEQAKSLLQALARNAPGSQVVLIPFHREAEAQAAVELDSSGLEELEEALDKLTSAQTGTPDLGGALDRAVQAAQDLGEDRKKVVLTVTSGRWQGRAEEGRGALDGQQITSYVLLTGAESSREQGNFWQGVCSRPQSACLFRDWESLWRTMASVTPVTVVQQLDPRFDLDSQEQLRLRREGARVEQQEGVWRVTWEADLPRPEETPWTASLVLRAKGAFPGGNDIPLDGPDTGLYLALKKVAALLTQSVNVPLRLHVRDYCAQLFLGEKVRISPGKVDIEKRMCPAAEPAWFGEEPTGAFSFTWETETGELIGGRKRLERQTPRETAVYRLRVAYRPFTDGAGSTGSPVTALEKTGTYKVSVVSGTIVLRLKGADPADGSRTLQVKKDGGQTWSCSLSPEGDPEKGGPFLAGELTGLPYGVYRVESGGQEQTLRLGVWEKDDRVSVKRKTARAEFSEESYPGIGTNLPGIQ